MRSYLPELESVCQTRIFRLLLRPKLSFSFYLQEADTGTRFVYVSFKELTEIVSYSASLLFDIHNKERLCNKEIFAFTRKKV